MPEYLVSWHIDVTADSPREAAEEAETYMLTTGARCFDVTERGQIGVRIPLTVPVDLDEETT